MRGRGAAGGEDMAGMAPGAGAEEATAAGWEAGRRRPGRRAAGRKGARGAAGRGGRGRGGAGRRSGRAGRGGGGGRVRRCASTRLDVWRCQRRLETKQCV